MAAVYLARYTNGTLRKFRAAHITQATKIAQGIAKSNNWKLASVGRA